MAYRAIARSVAVCAAATSALGALAALGAGSAAAASGSITWTDGSSQFTRTISDVSPAEGETVTVSTQFARNSIVDEYIYNIKDRHPACMTYVDGSAKMSNGTTDYPYANPEVVADEGNGGGYVRVSFSATNWPVMNRPLAHQSPVFSVQYKVGHDCARGTALTTGMDYGGSLGSGLYPTKGPSITVGKSTSTTSLAPVTDARVGQAATLTATVTGGSAGDPVNFFDGTAQIGSGTLDATGTATAQWTPTVKGAHSLTAKYPDSASATGSQSAAVAVQVADQNATSTVALAPVSDAQVGRASTVTATVSPAAAGGTVELLDGTTSLATIPVDAQGHAAYQWTPATSGAHTLTATFSGRDGVTGSTTTVTVSVADAPSGATASTTTLAAVSGAQVGAATTLTATVSPASAGGTVTFKDGGTVIGTATVGSDGTATLQWTPATAGQRTVSAEYSGAGTVNASSDRTSVVVGGGTGGTGSFAGLGSLSGGK
ncbi:Ig-like domain-containing protein [Nocardia stercoris]|uniref:Ig-like domain repeat protein n=1 Tax=Nocardia stercoris TaxID=2483361 RepID=A0A3M2KWT3_9NOCA|nr:Ig-like domain-containing protein [Nocardia stercoris]RMI29959.1 Ig-like domain repeat protein [Nocardia stercoris]